MRERHEKSVGVICERCLDWVLKDNYTILQFYKPSLTDTTGKRILINRMNLCNSCFEEYKKMEGAFIGRPFIENSNSKTKLDKLKQLREEMLLLKQFDDDIPEELMDRNMLNKM